MELSFMSKTLLFCQDLQRWRVSIHHDDNNDPWVFIKRHSILQGVILPEEPPHLCWFNLCKHMWPILRLNCCTVVCVWVWWGHSLWIVCGISEWFLMERKMYVWSAVLTCHDHVRALEAKLSVDAFASCWRLHCSKFHWSLFFWAFTGFMFFSSSGWRFCSMEGNTLFCGDTVNFRRFTGSWRRFCELLISPVRETSIWEPNRWSKDDRNWRTTSRYRYLVFILCDDIMLLLFDCF